MNFKRQNKAEFGELINKWWRSITDRQGSIFHIEDKIICSDRLYNLTFRVRKNPFSELFELRVLSASDSVLLWLGESAAIIFNKNVNKQDTEAETG